MALPDTSISGTKAATADTEVVALQALAWSLGDPGRARRLIDLTGLDPAALRSRAGEPAVLAAVLGFLEANEADLVACAGDLAVPPEALVRARAAMEAAA